ncbi:hypothetical protein C1I98_23935 [Spongiactinospora gelatinilytica]|uniref:Uncharacterized protein n=1 Tax=Spongiactinospora gelatinilytica TaxID=2666298 RepID=A0A2W2FNC3_9ACTN|nr:hypothetical protein C1I98_23935 [Spongiactinospora gelatinilytica]
MDSPLVFVAAHHEADMQAGVADPGRLQFGGLQAAQAGGQPARGGPGEQRAYRCDREQERGHAHLDPVIGTGWACFLMDRGDRLIDQAGDLFPHRPLQPHLGVQGHALDLGLGETPDDVRPVQPRAACRVVAESRRGLPLLPAGRSSATSVADMETPMSSDTVRIRSGVASVRSGTRPLSSSETCWDISSWEWPEGGSRK